MGKLFFHVDMDAFFASVESLDRPELRGKPVIVGGSPGSRGVVSTCSYEARRFGVHSAMPINMALKLCPGGVFLPVRIERYKEMSQKVFGVFDSFSPDVLPVSIDEAFLDMSGTERLLGPPEVSGRSLKEAVRSATGLAISVGAAPNRFLAKLASGRSKPDGLLVVAEGEGLPFMDGLPLDKLWGAGEKTQERFRELNIRSMADLRAYPAESLGKIFGRSMGQFLFLASRGEDPGIYSAETAARSISTERTFEEDVSDAEGLETILLEMSRELMYGLFRKGLVAYTAQVKIRYADFRTVSARKTFQAPFLNTEELFAQARSLFRAKREERQALRLLGLGLSGLDEASSLQGEFFGGEGQRKAALERAAFGIEERGRGKLRKARTLPGPGEAGRAGR